MPRRKITTWAKMRQLARERFPENADVAALALSEAAEVAEYANEDREAAEAGKVAKAAACEAVPQEHAVEDFDDEAKMDEDDVDDLEDFEDEVAEATSDEQRALFASFEIAQRDESGRRLAAAERQTLVDILDKRAARRNVPRLSLAEAHEAVVEARQSRQEDRGIEEEAQQAESQRWKEDMDTTMDCQMEEEDMTMEAMTERRRHRRQEEAIGRARRAIGKGRIDDAGTEHGEE